MFCMTKIAEAMDHEENRITISFEVASIKGVNPLCKRKMDVGKLGYEHPFTSPFTSRFTLTERVL